MNHLAASHTLALCGSARCAMATETAAKTQASCSNGAAARVPAFSSVTSTSPSVGSRIPSVGAALPRVGLKGAFMPSRYLIIGALRRCWE